MIFFCLGCGCRQSLGPLIKFEDFVIWLSPLSILIAYTVNHNSHFISNLQHEAIKVTQLSRQKNERYCSIAEIDIFYIMHGWNISKLKGSELYRLNSLSQWRQDVKPESWAENNPLVKAVLSIHLWKKKLSEHPQTPNPLHLGIQTHIRSLYRHTLTHTSRNALLESDIRALTSAHPPLMSFLCVRRKLWGVRCILPRWVR